MGAGQVKVLRSNERIGKSRSLIDASDANQVTDTEMVISGTEHPLFQQQATYTYEPDLSADRLKQCALPQKKDH
jgi:hypothetical protein